MIASASTSAGDSGPHQNASGSARSGPSSRKMGTRPKFDGLKMWRPRNVTRYFESSPTAEAAAKIHAPSMLHQSPCSVPGTRRMNATPFPVRSALAGHMSTRWRRNAIATSRIADVSTATRIWAIERSKSNADLPEHLERRDDRRQVEARIPQRRQQDRIGGASDVDCRPVGADGGRRAHRAIIVGGKMAMWEGAATWSASASSSPTSSRDRSTTPRPRARSPCSTRSPCTAAAAR